MTGSGLHATALIGLGTLIKTEKCLPPAPQDEETQAEWRVGGWEKQRRSPLKIWCGGWLECSANCVQLIG